MTNAGRIRAMTDDEMAIMLSGYDCPVGEFDKHKCDEYESCYHCWYNWLKQEVSDNG